MIPENFERTYVVTTPAKFVPGSVYSVCISIHYSAEPVEVTAVIQSDDTNGKVDLVSGTVTVKEKESKTLPLQTQSDWICGNRQFSITVTGKGGIKFQRSTVIRCLPKRYSIFIQCDQPVYLPGQTIEFQVITLDLDQCPFETDKIQVVVEDSRMTVVKKWPFQIEPLCEGRQSEYDMIFQGGVFTGKVMVPTIRPLYGEWYITALATDGIEQTRKSIIVAESIGSVFQVIFEAPDYVSALDETAEFSVSARYHNGKPFIGEVKLTLAPPIDCRCDQKPLQAKSLILQNSVKMVLPIAEKSSQWRTLFGRELTAQAEVFDPVLEAAETRTKKVMYYSKKNRIVIKQSAPDFIPNMNHRISILLVDHEGNLVQNSDATVMVVFSFHKDGKDRTSFDSPIPESGILNLDLTPKDDSDVILLTATYQGETLVSQASKIQSLSTKYLRLTLMTPNVKVGDEAEFHVMSTFPINTLIYAILSRSVLVSTDVLNVESVTSHRWMIPITYKMAPEASIVVYFVSSCGEVVTDALGFSVHDFLRTPLKIELQQKLYSLGENLNIKMVTDPDTDVFIHSTDERFISDSNQNYLTVNDVTQDLLGYCSNEWRNLGWFGNADSNGVQVRRSNAMFLENVFRDAGLILMSNGMYARKKITQAVIPRMSRALESFLYKGEIMRVHQSVADSWIEGKYNSEKSGIISKEYTVQYRETNWALSAFALSPLTGLGISRIKRIQAASDMKLSINSTNFLCFGETACVEAVVTNKRDQDENVEVKIAASDADITSGTDENEESWIQRSAALANTVTIFKFWVTPRLIKDIHLEVSLLALGVKKDTRNFTIEVIQQDECIHVCRTFLLDFDTPREFQQEVPIQLPENLMPGTEKSYVCFSGNALGPAVANMKQLLYMNLTFQTGEQCVYSAGPSFLILNYLKSQGKDCLYDVLANIDNGYLEMLSRYRRDASFSAFGEINQYGCTWLTAYFLRWVLDLRRNIYTDLALLQRGLCFLADKQSHEGIFEEQTPRAFQRPGWDVSPTLLSAYSILPFIMYRNADLPPDEVRKMRISVVKAIGKRIPQRTRSFDGKQNKSRGNEMHPMSMGASNQIKRTGLNEIIAKTVKYLESSLKIMKNAYDLAHTVYVLHLVDSDKKEEALDALEKLSHEENDMKYWVLPDTDTDIDTENRNNKQFYPDTQSVQIASYALLTYALRGGNKTDVMPVLRWLIDQMNDHGGFGCPFDTVLGIRAICTSVKDFSAKETDLTLQADYEGGSAQFHANFDNSTVLQESRLPESATNVKLSASGKGIGLAMVKSVFSVTPSNDKPYFLIDCVMYPYYLNTSKFYLLLTIAVSDIYPTFRTCRMAILVVAIPSGHNINFTEFLDQEKVKKTPKLQGYEHKHNKRTAHFCFEHLSKEPIFLRLPIVKVSSVQNIKQAYVALIDYYDHSRYNSVLYEAPFYPNEDDL